MTQVGEAIGQRVSHAPSSATHASARGGYHGDRNSCMWAHGLPFIEDFSSSG